MGPNLICRLASRASVVGLQAWMASMTGAAVRQQLETPVVGLAYTGQDFLPQHAVQGIDYAAVHLWPDNWKRTDQGFGSIWLRTHAANGAQLQKPVVVEEFGKVGSERQVLCSAGSPVGRGRISPCSPSSIPASAAQGVGGELAKGETAAQRLGWYREVYSIVQQQLQTKR